MAGDGSGSNVSDGERWRAADEASLAQATAHLLLCGPAPNREQGLGTPGLNNTNVFSYSSVGQSPTRVLLS